MDCGVTVEMDKSRYKIYFGGEPGIRDKVTNKTEGFLSPPTPTSCSYLHIHIYCTNGHLSALSGDGLLVLSQHTRLSTQTQVSICVQTPGLTEAGAGKRRCVSPLPVAMPTRTYSQLIADNSPRART